MDSASKTETARALRACLKYVRQDAASEGLSECIPHIDKAISTLDFVIAESELSVAGRSDNGDQPN